MTAPSLENTFAATGPHRAWQAWTESRDQSIRAPYGVLALTATVWLTADEQPVEDLPGRWSAAPEGRTRLFATSVDGFLLDGEPLDGTVELRPDLDPDPQSVTFGDRRLVPIVREGRSALRIYDPDSQPHETFEGLEHFPYNADLIASGRYTPFDIERIEWVLNADGASRGLALAGEVAFAVEGVEHRLVVSATADGLSATFGDVTNGADTFGFRFLALPVPDEDGTVAVDFNRAVLPPCAFTDHSLCPLPPAGNRLPVAIEAGERSARFRR